MTAQRGSAEKNESVDTGFGREGEIKITGKGKDEHFAREPPDTRPPPWKVEGWRIWRNMENLIFQY